MRRAAAALALTISLAAAGAVHAGPYSDELGKCLVSKTTDADRTELMVWLFEEMSVHPAVKPLTNVSDAQRDASRRSAAVLIQRLLTEDCRPQSADVLRNEGPGALQASFNAMGQAAMASMMKDPTVAASTQQIAQYLDVSKFAALMSDPGSGKK